jgi:hypothetical protein
MLYRSITRCDEETSLHKNACHSAADAWKPKWLIRPPSSAQNELLNLSHHHAPLSASVHRIAESIVSPRTFR